MGYYCIFYSCRINFYICAKGRNFLRMFGGVKGRVICACVAVPIWRQKCSREGPGDELAFLYKIGVMYF